MKDKFDTRTKMILYFLDGSKRFFVLSIVFACLVSLLDLINPKIISFTVDAVIDDKKVEIPSFIDTVINNHGGISWLRNNLWIIALCVICIALLGAVCRYLFNLFNSMGAERLVRNMREKLFSHIMRLPFSWHSENKTGDIIQRCTSDVDQIKIFLSEQLTSLFRVIVLIVIAMYFMFRIHWKLALTAAVFIPVIIAYSLFFHKRIGDSFEKADIEEGKLSSIAQENLTGVRVVRAFGREIYERERFEKQNSFYTKMWVDLMRLSLIHI